MEQGYVHGYTLREMERLQDQAATLQDLLHHDTLFAPGSRVLEAGCGVGAQTTIVAQKNPGAHFTSVDISSESLHEAERRVAAAGIRNVEFREADIYRLDYPEDYFDHIFLCFVLEHLQRPEEALQMLRRVLKRGGSLTVIEGDHGSAYFHPDSADAHSAIRCQVELQKRAGGDACIGRRLHPLLAEAGFSPVNVSPRMVYVDSSRPGLVQGFIRETFTAMIEGVREDVLRDGMLEAAVFERGIRDLYRTAEPGGTFCYTFFKAIVLKYNMEDAENLKE